MTDRKITDALKRIDRCKKAGHLLEATLLGYYIKVGLIRYMLSATTANYSLKDKKVRTLVNEFMDQIQENAELKSVINKKTFKSVKPWLGKMDVFFKKLKLGSPSNAAELQAETEKIFGILNISVRKLLLKHKD